MMGGALSSLPLPGGHYCYCLNYLLTCQSAELTSPARAFLTSFRQFPLSQETSPHPWRAARWCYKKHTNVNVYLSAPFSKSLVLYSSWLSVFWKIPKVRDGNQICEVWNTAKRSLRDACCMMAVYYWGHTKTITTGVLFTSSVWFPLSFTSYFLKHV